MERDPRTGEAFLRIVGKRSPPPLGQPPSAEARQALAAMSQYRTRAPKGIFVYTCHADMDADRMRWTIDKMVERARDG